MTDWYFLGKACEELQEESNVCVDLSGKGFKEEGADQIADYLADAHHLLVLDLSDNDLTTEGAKHIVRGLDLNRNLRALNLIHNQINGDIGFERLLHQYSGLTCLELSWNKLGHSGFAALADALEENKSLHTLGLAFCSVGAASGDSLVRIIQNSQIISLDLNHNALDPDVVAKLATALATNSVLRRLNLDHCGLGPEGATALAGALTQNHALTYLSLRFNKIQVEGGFALAEALSSNQRLKTLVLDSNKLGRRVGDSLVEHLKDNSSLTNLSLDAATISTQTISQINQLTHHNQVLSRNWTEVAPLLAAYRSVQGKISQRFAPSFHHILPSVISMLGTYDYSRQDVKVSGLDWKEFLQANINLKISGGEQTFVNGKVVTSESLGNPVNLDKFLQTGFAMSIVNCK